MVGCLARGGAEMHAGIGDDQIARHHDPVEPCDRAAGVEARAGLGEVIIAPEIAQAARHRAPFVETAHPHAPLPTAADLHLPPPPPPPPRPPPPPPPPPPTPPPPPPP